MGQHGGGPGRAQSEETRPGRAQGTLKVLVVVLGTVGRPLVGRAAPDQAWTSKSLSGVLWRRVEMPESTWGASPPAGEQGARRWHWREASSWEGFMSSVPRIWGG